MADMIEVNDAASPSLIDGVILPEKDGFFAIYATARHTSNNQGTPTMRLKITINDKTDYESKNIGWQDGPAEQHALTTEFMRAGEQYLIAAQSFNSNAAAQGITMSAKRI
jgi:hypothetical protein